jgi:hypothetical protein
VVERFEDQRSRTAGGPEVFLGGAVGVAVEAGVGEGGEDVFEVVAGDGVEVEVGGVEFGVELGPLRFFPDMDAVAARASSYRLPPDDHNEVLIKLVAPLQRPTMNGKFPDSTIGGFQRCHFKTLQNSD